MKVLFRVDSSFEIGMGHLMRCLTLASALKEHGARCCFLCRDHPGASLDLVRERGFELQVLPVEADPAGFEAARTMHASWVGGDPQEDAEATARAIRDDCPDWVVVDHYGLDATWEALLGSHGCRLLVIDDLADRPHLCDLLLDQTPGRSVDDYAPWLLRETRLLLGGDHALLRAEFAQHREASLERRVSGRVDHVLVSMGGSDPNGVSARVLQALEHLPESMSFRVSVVMNGRSPALDLVRKGAQSASRDTRVLCDVTDMASLMAESDLAIGGAGTTSWERCCLGLPSILVILAANQQLVADRLEAAGAAAVMHDFCESDASSSRFASTLAELLESPDQVAGMATAAARLVDGKGAGRVVEAMRGVA